MNKFWPFLLSKWPVIVRPNSQPYWKFRRWRKKGHRLVGAYRTPRGSRVGEIQLSLVDPPKHYIFNPPPALLAGSHGACFRPDGSRRYWVHFHESSKDIDAGIVAIEQQLFQALSGNRA